MNLRVTTRATLNGYNRNLNRTLSNLNSARDKVLTGRKFNSVAEDPASAARSMQLRRNYMKNETYLENLNTVQSIFDGVEGSGMQINNILKNSVNPDLLAAVNGATSYEERKTYATTLRGMQESIVLSANATYGDRFLFGGKSTDEVPFVLAPDGTLTYRGIDVNSTDPGDMAKLDAMAKETLFIDLGFGLKEDAAGNVIGQSAFNLSTPGLNLLGYGNNADGNSKNIVTLLGDMAKELEKPDLDTAKFEKMMNQFTESRNEVIDFVTHLGTQSNFLETTKTRLTDNQSSMNENIVAVERVDIAEAITTYSWEQYCYNAALKVGSGILTPSFIDFMK